MRAKILSIFIPYSAKKQRTYESSVKKERFSEHAGVMLLIAVTSHDPKNTKQVKNDLQLNRSYKSS